MRRMALALVFAGCAATIHPCCTVSRNVGKVHFRGQLNIIVWDRETNTQHFIRNAKFDSEEKQFAFIAPSPTVPELAEANPRAFETLVAIQRALPKDGPFAGEGKAAASSSGGVEVLGQEKVAGYDAAILRSDDPKALKSYLDKNGYKTSPDIQEWLQFYIDKKWVFTAFKVDGSRGEAETGLIRMSFKTNRPFNPYYVPFSNQEYGAELGVYMISDRVMEPDRAGETGKYLHKEWSAQIPEKEAESIGADLGIRLPKQPVVAFYGDFDFPMNATADIWFNDSGKDPRSLPKPGPSGINPLWIGVAGGGVAGFAAWFLTQRKRQ